MNEQNFTPNDPNRTNLVPAKCTNCGGEITVDPNQETAICQYCRTPFIVSKAVQNYNIQHNTYQTNIVNDQRKGTVESILSYASERQDKREQRLNEERLRKEEKKKKRNKTILWVLGWLFIFPVPLTILMLRNKEMNKKVKYGIIAAGWIVYLILCLTSGGSDRSTEPAPPEENTSIVTTVPEETTASTTEKPATTVQETAVTETASPTEAAVSGENVVSTTEMPSTAVQETTITETGSAAETTVTETDGRKAVENGDYSLVTPEFKETMDAYEAFYDEYIAFMNKYSSSNDNGDLLNDYMSMLTKMEEWRSKIDAIDVDKLSPADDAYYLLVTMRIEKKLLSEMQ